MKVQSLYLHGVRGLPDINLDFVDPATGLPRQRTVIAGSNGTGKTTILDVVFSLFEFVKGTSLTWYRRNESRAGMTIFDPLFAPNSFISIEVGDDRQAASTEPTGPLFGRTSGPAMELRTRVQEAEAGEVDFANCLYFPSEDRELHPKRAGQVIAEPDDYQWTFRFSDSQKWEGSLESFLVAMDYRDLMAEREGGSRNGGEFRRFTRLINDFLQGKQIVGVDQKTFRVLVKATNGQQLNLDVLSSGEKQIVLILGEIQRRIRHGSVLLLDEPEIHLHPRWQRLLVRALSDLASEYDAQLIITTHSEEIANAVFEHERVLLDDVFVREDKA